MTITDLDLVAEQIIYLDPATILPDPTNPRGKLRDIDGMAASIESVGVLEPITVRFVEVDGVQTPVLSRGHRRLAGALKAKLDRIPAKLDGKAMSDTGERHRATARLVENIQRDNFNPVEEARGIQQLLDLGLDTASIAKDLAVPEERVDGLVAISGSKVATTVTERHDLSFEQALVMVEFEGDKETVKLLTVAAVDDPDQFPHVVAQVRGDRQHQAALDAGIADFKAKGYAIIEQPLWNDTKTVALNYLKTTDKANGKRLTTASHAECPGRAVVLHTNYNFELLVAEYCVDWKANGHGESNGGGGTSPSRPKPELSDKEREAATLKRRTHNAALKAGRAAQEVRREFVRGVLGRKAVPPGTLRFATEALLSYRIEDASEQFREITGSDPKPPRGIPSSGYDLAMQAQRAFIRGLPEARMPLALLAQVAAHVEAHWEPNTWESSKDPLRIAYLRHLARCGYTPSLIEKVALGQAKPAAVLDEAQRLKAAAKADKTAKAPSPAAKSTITRPAPTKRAGSKAK